MRARTEPSVGCAAEVDNQPTIPHIERTRLLNALRAVQYPRSRNAL
jgi:hypothetical protein